MNAHHLTMTHHAAARVQQRAIPPAVVDWLVRFGRPEQSHGATVFAFDKRAWRNLEVYLGPLGLSGADKIRNAYVVLGEGDHVITAGYRTQRRKSA